MTGKEIREAREKLDMSLTALAAAAGMNKQTLSMIELEKSTRPAYDTMTRIVTALKAAQEKAGQVAPEAPAKPAKKAKKKRGKK